MTGIVEYPCPNCNSELNYNSENQGLKCAHCGTLISIASDNELIAENNISEYFNTSLLPVGELKEINYVCTKCGKENINTQDIAFFECRYCGNNVVNTEAYKSKAIIPSSIVPFEISREEAFAVFQDWIGRGFWDDSDLKKMALIDKVQGCYIPFWTFDSNTQSEWSGEAGTYYDVEQRYKDTNGNEQIRTVRKIRWRYKSGVYTHFFNDVLVSGSKDIRQEVIEEVYPYNLEVLKPFNFQYLLGWNAKAYDGDMNECYQIFRNHINNEISRACERELADDTYRDLSVKTTYSGETFKHIILPVWYCQYLFKGKTYFFIINGQTGKISGDKPVSTTKIVLAIIVVIIIVFLLFAMMFSS